MDEKDLSYFIYRLYEEDGREISELLFTTKDEDIAAKYGSSSDYSVRRSDEW